MDDATLRDLAHLARVDSQGGHHAFIQRNSEIIYRRGLVLARNRVDHHSTNYVFRTSDETSASDAVAIALEFFAKSSSGFGNNCRDWNDADVLEEAIAHGLSVAYRAAPYVVAEGQPPEIVAPSGVTLMSTPSQKLADDFAHVASTVFGDTEGERNANIQLFDGSDMFSPFTKYFVAYVDGQPAAVSALWRSRCLPCINWVRRSRNFASVALVDW